MGATTRPATTASAELAPVTPLWPARAKRFPASHNHWRAGYGVDVNLPPVHEVSGLAAMRQLKASQVGFFASTYQPGRDVVRLKIGPPGLGVEPYLTHSPEAAELLLSAK